MLKIIKLFYYYYNLKLLKFHSPQLSVGKNFKNLSGCKVSRGRIIKIGNDFYMGHNCFLSADVNISNDVMFASGVALIGADHDFSDPDVLLRLSGRANSKGIQIESNVWVGHNAIILDGVRIGQGSIIGAGSIVTKNVEPYSIVAGNPAKIIKYRIKS